MFVYSHKIHAFIEEIKSTIKAILTQEVGLKVANSRFYDKSQRTSYPISVVIFNNKPMLGYFDPSFYELGFHESLMYRPREMLYAIIRHEIAHYITFMEYGPYISSHGPEFRAFCHKMGWGETVYRATTCLEDEVENGAIEESAILRKVQKLMALASSSNAHEAEQALIKSRELLIKHQLEAHQIEGASEEKVCLKRLMKQKREDAKMRAIAKIVETFFVNVVYKRGEGFIVLEILGQAAHVEIAEYVASVLTHELENLWDQTKRTHRHLKGQVARNSFFLGIARGYCQKIQALKQELNPETTRTLMVLEKQLTDAKNLVYPRLSTSYSRTQHCSQSSLLGELLGKSLNINPALRHSTNNTATYRLT